MASWLTHAEFKEFTSNYWDHNMDFINSVKDFADKVS